VYHCLSVYTHTCLVVQSHCLSVYAQNKTKKTDLHVVPKGQVAEGADAPHGDEDAGHAADDEALEVLRPLHGPLLNHLGAVVNLSIDQSISQQ